MRYALAALGIDSGAACPLLPSATGELRAKWAEMRSKWGCPERYGNFWFFTNAPSLHWYGQLSSLVRPMTFGGPDVSERKMAFREWETHRPDSSWVPPFLLDYSAPVSTAKPVQPPAAQLPAPPPIAPPTTIPCYCWSSPGFKQAHAEAYQQVQRDDCNFKSDCMQQQSTKNLINYRALERGATLCDEKYDPCCGPSGGKESCPGGRTSKQKMRQALPTLIGVVALGALAYYMMKRSNQRHSAGR